MKEMSLDEFRAKYPEIIVESMQKDRGIKNDT